VNRERNVKHDFDLTDLNVGQMFMGCRECGFRLRPDEAAGPVCPECGRRLGVFVVTEEDAVGVKERSKTSKWR